MIYKSKYKILSSYISACDYEFLIGKVDEAIQNNNKLYIAPIASHTLVLANDDKKLANDLSKFDHLVPDSQWVKWSLYFLYKVRLKYRVYGPELMKQLLQKSRKNGYRIYLYGTNKATLKSLKETIYHDYPDLKIVGVREGIYRELNAQEERSMLNDIGKSKANIIFVGLGSPMQESFTSNVLSKLSNPVVAITVGAAFDFLSGTKPQAPAWIGSIGFEWLYRLIIEPRRLWKRYIVNGSRFVVKILFHLQ